MVQNSPNERDDAHAPAQPAAPAVGVAATARRRLLRTGLVGGPVALMTAGKPVKTLASTYCSFSGWNSANVTDKKKSKKTLSHTPPTGSCSAGYGPGRYYTTAKVKGKETTVAANWPSPYTAQNGTASTYTMSSLGFSPVLLSSSVLTILSTESSSVEALAIAAYFDGLAGGFYYSGPQVQSLWTQYANNNPDGSLTNAIALQDFLAQLVTKA